MKKCYLDIDGVILDKEHKPANGLLAFLKTATENYDCYWLTTHCVGDAKYTIEFLEKYLTPEMLEYAKKVKPTKWGAMKTDAIDFDSDFIWLDDYVMFAEMRVLKEKGKLDSLIKIDLKNNPDQLTGLSIFDN